ncbi:MAG: hypothetical protein WC839_00220 [Candidatus Paceibacterota bacterium]
MSYGDFVLAIYIFSALIIFLGIAFLTEKFVFKTNFYKKILDKFEEF